MNENADTSQAIFKPPPGNWRQPPGQPHTTWMKNIHDDLSPLDLGIHEAKDMVQNQPLCKLMSACYYWNTHTHTRLMALFPGLPGWASTRKVKPILILLKQETMSGSGISWATCKSASRSRQITMPVPHQSSFLQAGCPSWCPTNSVKAPKAITIGIVTN